MNHILKSVFCFLVFTMNGFAQVPTYQLAATNGFWDPNEPNHYDFEFQLTWSNSGTVSHFEYAGGQYFMDIDPVVANGGTLSMSKLSSDLPLNMHPRNPTVYTGSYPWQLRWAVNTFPGAGNGFMMPAFVPVEIVRMKIQTSAASLIEGYSFPVYWRNGPTNPFTKIFAYVGTTNTDISTPTTHSVGLDWWPVEMAAFTSTVNRNIIKLSWTTVEEINNHGFRIERKKSNSDDWIEVGFVEGSGTTTEMKSYSFSEKVQTGKYNYRLKQIDYNGHFEYFNLTEDVLIGIPSEFAMSQNYPNPFNPSTKIDYEIPVDGIVNLVVYDLSGREVSKPVNEFIQAGFYTLNYSGSNISSGVYFYRMSSGKFVQTKKMLLVK